MISNFYNCSLHQVQFINLHHFNLEYFNWSNYFLWVNWASCGVGICVVGGGSPGSGLQLDWRPRCWRRITRLWTPARLTTSVLEEDRPALDSSSTDDLSVGGGSPGSGLQLDWRPRCWRSITRLWTPARLTTSVLEEDHPALDSSSTDDFGVGGGSPGSGLQLDWRPRCWRSITRLWTPARLTTSVSVTRSDHLMDNIRRKLSRLNALSVIITFQLPMGIYKIINIIDGNCSIRTFAVIVTLLDSAVGIRTLDTVCSLSLLNTVNSVCDS